MLETGQGWTLGPGNLEGAVWDIYPNAGTEALQFPPHDSVVPMFTSGEFRAWNIHTTLQLFHKLNCPKRAIETLPVLGGLWE